MKSIKHLILFIVALLTSAAVATAATLTYTTPPQTSDSELILQHKQIAGLVSGNAYVNVASAATTVVKTGAGVLERIIVNKAGTGTTIVIYDNTAGSGTKIATLTSTAQNSIAYNIRFSTGLTIVTDAGSGAADVTVSYR